VVTVYYKTVCFGQEDKDAQPGRDYTNISEGEIQFDHNVVEANIDVEILPRDDMVDE
jgi:hypothetical protein